MSDLIETLTPDGARGGTIDVSAMTLRRLEELGRLREIGMGKARALDTAADGLSSEEMARRLCGRHGLIGEFDRVARAVRQVIVLELEVVGLRPAPDREEADEDDADELAADRDFLDARGDRGDGFDRPERDDSHDPSDYRRGPLDVVVAEVRKTLGVEAPEDDPFAPPPGRRGAQAAPKNVRASKTPSRPSMRPRAKAPVKTSPKDDPAPKRSATLGRLMASTALPARTGQSFMPNAGTRGRGPPSR